MGRQGGQLRAVRETEGEGLRTEGKRYALKLSPLAGALP